MKLKTCLIAVNRAFNSDFESLYLQTKLLIDRYDKVYFLNSYKTHKVLDKMHCRVDEVIDIYPFIASAYEKKYSTWQEAYDDFDVSEIPHIDDIWVFGGILSEGSRLVRKHPDTLDFLLDKNRYMAYISLCVNFCRLYATLKIAHKYNCQVHEICYDPCEYSFALLQGDMKLETPPIVYHGYDVHHLGMKRLDTYQLGMEGESITPLLFDSYDLVYGYSYMTKDRKHVHEEVQSLLDIPDKEIKIFCKNKFEGTDNFVSRSEYLSHINSSDFTLIMPAYCKGVFSVYRFIESIKLNCLPLVHHTCSIDEICASFDMTFVEIMITNKQDLINRLNMSEETRLSLIQYYKEKMNIL